MRWAAPPIFFGMAFFGSDYRAQSQRTLRQRSDSRRRFSRFTIVSGKTEQGDNFEMKAESPKRNNDQCAEMFAWYTLMKRLSDPVSNIVHRRGSDSRRPLVFLAWWNWLCYVISGSTLHWMSLKSILRYPTTDCGRYPANRKPTGWRWQCWYFWNRQGLTVLMHCGTTPPDTVNVKYRAPTENSASMCKLEWELYGARWSLWPHTLTDRDFDNGLRRIYKLYMFGFGTTMRTLSCNALVHSMRLWIVTAN